MENKKYHGGDSNEQNLPLETSSEQRQNDFIISTFAFRDPFILKKIMKFSMIGLWLDLDRSLTILKNIYYFMASKSGLVLK